MRRGINLFFNEYVILSWLVIVLDFVFYLWSGKIGIVFLFDFLDIYYNYGVFSITFFFVRREVCVMVIITGFRLEIWGRFRIGFYELVLSFMNECLFNTFCVFGFLVVARI